jgi:hypothetical protein
MSRGAVVDPDWDAACAVVAEGSAVAEDAVDEGLVVDEDAGEVC